MYQYWAFGLLQATTVLPLYEEGTSLTIPLTCPRCDVGTQPETPSSSQKVVSRGTYGLSRVDNDDGDQIRTKRARSTAGSKLRDDKSQQASGVQLYRGGNHPKSVRAVETLTESWRYPQSGLTSKLCSTLKTYALSGRGQSSYLNIIVKGE